MTSRRCCRSAAPAELSKTDSHRVAAAAATAGDEPEAARLAALLGIPLLPTAIDPRRCDVAEVLLTIDGGSLALQITGRNAPGPVAVDFGSGAMRHRRRAGHNEMLGRAVGVGKRGGLRVVDATAGLGRDSFVLADLGCEVTLCERNPLFACLLDFALSAAREGDDPWLNEVCRRMRLHRGPAQELELDADVIYLDPMFPERAKSAAVKKEMALFQLLLREEPEDGGALLSWALSRPVARVVVKRPPRAPDLGGCAPSHRISGKAIRYDVYVMRSLAD